MSEPLDGGELLALLQAMGARVFRATLPELEAPVSWPPLTAALRQVATDGATRVVEHPMAWDGEPDGWARTTVIRPPGATRTVIGAMLDITAAHRDERQWHELESWLVSLGEALPFDLWIGDRGGRCVLQNPASVRRLGPALGRRFDELNVPEAWLELWNRGLQRALVGETTREELVWPLNGEPRHLVRVISPVWTDSGVHGALGVDLDVTGLKVAEARLRDSLEELARTQEALVQRREMAALGEMAAVVAHEIRNPLGAISNVASLLRRASAATDQPALCQIIEDEVFRLDGLVRALLEFVRPITPELQPEALAPLVEEALCAALKHDARGDRIRVRRRLDGGVAGVPMDRALLRVALDNVLRNALQALPDDGELEVSVEREAEGPAAWAKVAVRDTGPGLQPEIEDRLFHPFVTTRPTGSGMGLAIVKRIVDGHRGLVGLTNAGGGGTVCTIRLPLGQAAKADALLSG